jgi:hypothetical protein
MSRLLQFSGGTVESREEGAQRLLERHPSNTKPTGIAPSLSLKGESIAEGGMRFQSDEGLKRSFVVG